VACDTDDAGDVYDGDGGGEEEAVAAGVKVCVKPTGWRDGGVYEEEV
jgi:hypothetical protein